MTGRRVLAVALLTSALGCAARISKPASVAAPPAPIADATVAPLLARACFGCHTTEAQRPWYAHLAPSSWDAAARDDLNFSDWSIYDEARRGEAMEAIALTVRSGAMPPRDYTFFDRAAALDDEERDALVRWASRSAATSTSSSAP